MASESVPQKDLGARSISKLYRAKKLDATVLLENLTDQPISSASTARKLLKVLFDIAQKQPEYRQQIIEKIDRYRFHENQKLAQEITEFLALFGEAEVQEEIIDKVEADFPPELLPDEPVVPWTDETAPLHMAEIVAGNSDPLLKECALVWLATTESDPKEVLHSFSSAKSSSARSRQLVKSVFEGFLDTSKAPLLSLASDSHGWVELADLESCVARFGAENTEDLARALYRLREDDFLLWQKKHPELVPNLSIAFGNEVITEIASYSRQFDKYGIDCHTELIDEPWVLPHSAQVTQEIPAFVLNPSAEIKQVREETRGEDTTVELTVRAGFIPEMTLATPGYLYPLARSLRRLMLLSMSHSAGDESEILKVLLWHEGLWTAEVVELVAIGMASMKSETRLVASEVLAMGVSARFYLCEAAKVLAGIASEVMLTRWASSLQDAARLTPYMVRDLLVELLPQLDSKQRGIGDLLELLLDLVKRTHGFELTDSFADHLRIFRGATKAGMAASDLLATKSTDPANSASSMRSLE